MRGSHQTSLSQSWVTSTADDGSISWAEESDLSDEEVSKSTPPKLTSKQRRISAQKSPSSPHTNVYRQSEFMMPSVESLSPQKDARKERTQSTHTKRTQVPQQRAPREMNSTVRALRSSHQPAQGKVSTMVLEVGEYLYDIILSTLKKLKQPISWVLAAYLFAGGLVLVQNLLTSSISHALSPICRIPGVSFLSLPICSFTSRYQGDSDNADDVPTIDGSRSGRKKKSQDGSSSSNHFSSPEFDNLMQVQSQFSTIIDSSSSQVALTLPFDMKRSETSIRDLKQIVRFSTIPSKNEIVHEFDGFIETARLASYDLQKFNSHVGRAVDNVLSTTRWTSRALDEIAAEKSSRGIIPSFLQDRLLAPFQPLRFSENRILEQYILHSRIVGDEIARLIDEATGLLSILSNLEDRLDVIHGIALRDGVAAKADRDEVLSQLWTYLGGNRSKIGKFDNQLKLLGRVAEYRKLAYAHVSSTVVKLQAMGAELEELRSRVGAVEVLRDSGRAVPLHVHLEAIRLGVERLEGQREKAREVEKGHVRRVIDSGHDADEVKLLVDAA